MSNINFDNPYLLFLALPIALLFVIPYAIAVRKENLNGHNIASGIIHILLALLIAFVAAGTSIVTTVTETNVYVVADVSYSANRNLDAIDGYISRLGNSLPRNSKMGVVTFGKNYQLLTPLGEDPQSVKNSRVDDSATDIISALRYTGELFREDVIKRIVLITDGKQTAETDSNALKRQVDALAERNIHVDAIYLDDNISENAREVQLSAADVTPTTFLNGETYARLTVNCMCPETTVKDGVVVAYEVEAAVTVTRRRTDDGSEGEETSTEIAYFTRGSNYYDVPLYTEEAGIYDYEVKIGFENQAAAAAADGNPHNNVISFTQEVSGRQKVLVIYKDESDYELISQIYGQSADMTRGYYRDESDTGIKTTVEWINQFDEIIIANVDVTEINNWSTLLKCIDKAVSMFGKSLLTFGDTNIQNYTKGELRALSDMLPVKFGKSESGGSLYTLLIDTSRSMEQHGRLDRAKYAAKELVKLLDEEDTVALIQFNGSPANVLTRLAEDGRQEVLDAIDALEVRQGTNIPAALQYSINTATGAGVEYNKKSLMIFSDGMNFVIDNSSSQSVRRTVDTLRDRGVVTSALDVGRDGVEPNAAARAKSLLENDIATRGGGKYMPITSNAALDEVIKTQLPEEVNSSEGTFSQIYVNRRGDDVFIDSGDANKLANEAAAEKFVYSRAKGAATTVMSVNFIGALGSVTSVPLYSYWDYGNGKVASLTAGITDEWLYMDNGLRERLIRGIMSSNVPEQKISEPFTVDIEATDGYAEVTLTPEKMSLDAVTSIEITFDDGKEPPKTTAPVALANANSKFTHTFITGEEGKYTVKITYKERETSKEEYTVVRTVHVAYSSEYDSFALYGAGTLHKMIGAQGTVSEDGNLTIVNDEKEVGLYNVSLAMPLLIACVVLFAVDIAVRKLKWEDVKGLFTIHRKVKKQ